MNFHDIPTMPEEFIGKTMKKSSILLHAPRRWTKDEITWCLDMKQKGYAVPQIAYSVKRDSVQVGIKLKRLQKKDGSYNATHSDEKSLINKEFVEHIGARTVLDLYSRNGNPAYDGLQVTSNDIDQSVEADYHMDALKLLCKFHTEGNRVFDYVDLDPYGSCYECLDLAIRMAKKGIAITFGEIGHKRWKRLDYVRDRYGIDSLDEFNMQKMIEEVQRIGRLHHKELKVYKTSSWRNIGRVWLTVEKYKVTEQWEKNKYHQLELF